MPDLTGHHALVTGGGTGIGLAIAEALAGAGAEVTIAGRRNPPLIQAASGNRRLHPLVMDVTEEAQVSDGIASATTVRGPVTLCIANAGIAEGRALHRTDLAFWRQIMATNLDGAFLTIRECLDPMRDAPMGRVIAVSSMAGLRGLKGAAAYTASKHRLVGLVRALAEDYKDGRITFNALCPGHVDTDIVTDNLDRIIMARTGMDADAAGALLVGTNTHGRLVDPGEVAAAALWLCDPLSGSVNGQCIEIDGGQP